MKIQCRTTSDCFARQIEWRLPPSWSFPAIKYFIGILNERKANQNEMSYDGRIWGNGRVEQLLLFAATSCYRQYLRIAESSKPFDNKVERQPLWR